MKVGILFGFLLVISFVWVIIFLLIYVVLVFFKFVWILGKEVSVVFFVNLDFISNYGLW